MENCENCKFSKTRTYSVSLGRDVYEDRAALFCARHAPVPNFLQPKNETGWPMAEFPVVNGYLWCGEYIGKASC